MRTKELAETERRARLALANAEAEFNTVMAKNQASWAVIEEKHQKRVAEMGKEIEKLENKRLNALIPVKIIAEATEGRLKSASEYVSELKQREEKINETQELLEDKLDEVGQIKEDILKQESKLKLREEGLQRQTANQNILNKQLSVDLALFNANVKKVNKELDDKKTALILQEQSLKAKEMTIKRTDRALLDKERLLASERQTLDAAWKELHAKYPPKQ